jgi:DNA-binding LacI/PurR family transcriptional regulator
MREPQPSVARRLTGSGPSPSVGFLVDWLEDSHYHWPIVRGAMLAARERGAHLFCFVGGPLGSETRPDPRNAVFDFAAQANVDALLVLSGPLSHSAGSTALDALCRRFRPVPICSIAFPLPGVSSVCIDNEAGMRLALEHLIRTHGRKKLAFIRGPVANDEAELRLQVYREVLGENDITYLPDLLAVGDFGRTSGREAVKTFFHARKLPVSDVQAIVASNDAMALGAMDELRAQGIRVPEQVAVVGFDDVEDARFSTPPLTTVNQPLDDQGREAVRVVLDALRKPGPAPEHAIRATELVVRQSCGCIVQDSASVASSNPPGTTLGFDAALLRRRQHILADMQRAARGRFGAAGARWDERLLSAIAEQVRGDSPDSFLRAYDELLRRLIVIGVDPSVGNELLSAMRARVVRCIADVRRRTATEDVFHRARVLTTQAVEGVQVERRWRASTEARAVLETIAAVAAVRDMKELARVVRAHLPRIGIMRCFLIALLGTGKGAMARYVVYEKPGARDVDGVARPPQPAAGILRDCLRDETDQRALAVYPIVLGAGEHGLLVLELGSFEGHSYDVMKRAFETALAHMRP